MIPRIDFEERTLLNKIGLWINQGPQKTQASLCGLTSIFVKCAE